MTAPFFSPSAFSTPVFAAFNHVLDQADWARQQLQPFAGRNVRIAMAPFSFAFAIGSDGRLQESSVSVAKPAELEIILPANTPFLALQGNEQVMKAAQINGPADLAETLSLVLRHLRWDIEEDLSKIFGDIVAHRMMAALNAFAGWHQQAARNLSENVGEYLVEENQTLVKRYEISDFSAGVASLCDNLSRIEARINQLGEKSS
jgi:ubiquinone biosynthesis protein UbiJ